MVNLQTYYGHLLTLSGNALHDDTRQRLFRAMSDEDVNGIITYSLTRGPGREDRMEMAGFLVDVIKRGTTDEVAGDAVETATTFGE
jgi:hypothetical protein